MFAAGFLNLAKGAAAAPERESMSYTKEDLKEQLKEMGLRPTDTVLMHSSMKAMGDVEGGADTVLDALMEYFAEGLLLLPTHTWAQMGSGYTVFDRDTEPACVGILPNLFRKRPGVIRSLHPTHSMAGFGREAAEYLAGEEEYNTPCTPGGCYDRLRERNGRILLAGVTHARNTFIHGVEEVLNVPHRLTDMPCEFYTKLPDGSLKKIYMRRHFNSRQPYISEDFVKLTQAFYDTGAAKKVQLGEAECILCDARGIFEVTRHVLAPDPECIILSPTIPSSRWEDFCGGPYFQ